MSSQGGGDDDRKTIARRLVAYAFKEPTKEDLENIDVAIAKYEADGLDPNRDPLRELLRRRKARDDRKAAQERELLDRVKTNQERNEETRQILRRLISERIDATTCKFEVIVERAVLHLKFALACDELAIPLEYQQQFADASAVTTTPITLGILTRYEKSFRRNFVLVQSCGEVFIRVSRERIQTGAHGAAYVDALTKIAKSMSFAHNKVWDKPPRRRAVKR